MIYRKKITHLCVYVQKKRNVCVYEITHFVENPREQHVDLFKFFIGLGRFVSAKKKNWPGAPYYCCCRRVTFRYSDDLCTNTRVYIYLLIQARIWCDIIILFGLIEPVNSRSRVTPGRYEWNNDFQPGSCCSCYSYSIVIAVASKHWVIFIYNIVVEFDFNNV